MSISQQMILFWKLFQFTQRRPDLQKWLHFWSPKDNVNLATWAKWSSKQKQQVLWRGLKKEIESVRLSRTWQACQPDTPFNGHMSRLIFRFSLGIAGPFKIGDCSFVFWWCKKLDTEKSSRSAAQHGFWVKPQDSMPVGQMELVGPPGTVWACDFGVGEAAQWLFLVSFCGAELYKVRWFQHVATIWWSWDLSQWKWYLCGIRYEMLIWLPAPRTRVVNLFGSIFNATQLGVTRRAICSSTWGRNFCEFSKSLLLLGQNLSS